MKGITEMELRTPQAINKIKMSNKNHALVDGKQTSILEAMSFAINYHTLDIKETSEQLTVTGTNPVIRVDKFLL